jgi:hypothetical protein
VSDFLKKYAAWVGAIAALIFALGFGAARYTTPVKVVEKEKLVEKLVTDKSQTTAAQSNEKKDDTSRVAKKERKHIERDVDTIIRPDGTKEIKKKTIIDTGNSEVAQNNVHEEKQSQVQQQSQEHQKLELTEEKSKETTYARPGLRISLLLGADLGKLKFDPLPKLAEVPGPVFGVEVEKRMFLNVWAGAWAMKLPETFAGGVKASLEF